MTESYWWYITLKGPSGRGEVLNSLAEASGSIGSEEQDKTESVELRAYYKNSNDLGHWVECLTELLSQWPDISIYDMGKIENRQWHTQCLEAFPPLNIGTGFVVLAPWHRGKEPEGRIPLYINPGSAFGTGYHESTQNVLTLMERYMKPGCEVADIGCGSAILSIASVKLGAGAVTARDYDPAVMSEAASNIELNEMDPDRIKVEVGDLLKGFDSKVDLLVANILIGPLTDMVPDVPSVLKPEGVAIFSGLVRKEREAFLEAVKKAGLKVLDEVYSDDWYGLAVGLAN